MKRIVVFLAMALMAFSVAQAESEQDSTFVFGPADTETAAPELTPSPPPASTPIPTDSGDSGFDFSQVDNPLATPVAVNPIDMPTPTPTPAPNYNTLSKGDKSNEVLDMQNRLWELGFLLDDRDGYFGSKTQTAV